MDLKGRPFHKGKDALKRAIEFRKAGKSYSEIAKELMVSKSTLNYWFNKAGMLSTLTHLQLCNENRKRKIERAYVGQRLAKAARDKRRATFIDENVMRLMLHLNEDLFKFGIIWYWAEGTKEKATSFCNQEFKPILMMKKFFDKYFPTYKQYYKLYVHENKWKQRYKAKKNWETFLHVAIDKIYMKKGTKKKRDKHKRNYRGLCSVSLRGSQSTWAVLVIKRFFDILYENSMIKLEA